MTVVVTVATLVLTTVRVTSTVVVRSGVWVTVPPGLVMVVVTRVLMVSVTVTVPLPWVPATKPATKPRIRTATTRTADTPAVRVTHSQLPRFI